MQFAGYEISLFNFGFFRLDGGAMFGSVPKNLWSKKIEADEENCIKLATRSLILKSKDRLIVTDVGLGFKWNDKLTEIFAINSVPESEYPFRCSDVTDVIITHLHFDHAGGISKFDKAGKLVPTYPNATIHIQKANIENAKKPSLKEKASYLEENYNILDQCQVNIVDGEAQILPNIFVHQINGHTIGQQLIEVIGENKSIVYPTDLIPTSRHLPIPFHMGYDAYASTVLEEKTELLKTAFEREDIIVFEHDPDLPAATITKDNKGHYTVKDVVEF